MTSYDVYIIGKYMLFATHERNCPQFENYATMGAATAEKHVSRHPPTGFQKTTSAWNVSDYDYDDCVTATWIGFGDLSSSFYSCCGLDSSHFRCALFREHEMASETRRKTEIDGGGGFCSHPHSNDRKDSDSSVCIFLLGKHFGRPSFAGDNVPHPGSGFGFGFDVERHADLDCPCWLTDV